MAFEHVFDTSSFVKLWHQFGGKWGQVPGTMISHALAIDEHRRWVHDVVNVDGCTVPWYNIFDYSKNGTVIRALQYVSFGLAKF